MCSDAARLHVFRAGSLTLGLPSLHRTVLSELDDALFKFVFRLFDPNNTGKVDADAFVAATALLTRGTESVDDQVGTCFHMFDTTGNGVLTQPEFRAMMEATVALNLNRFVRAHAPLKWCRSCERDLHSQRRSLWR